ncbi:MAG: hypothetical protein IJS32_05070 [Kiritimatiellae bacterium]|nr:hypothetical protein [Kiritimatiellia bacterium]
MELSFPTLLLAALLLAAARPSASAEGEPDVVARLDGHVMGRGKLAVLERRPDAPDSPEALLRAQAGLVRRWVFDIRKEEAKARYRIEVSDEEVRDKLFRMIGDPEESVRRIEETKRRLVRALRTARAEPARADEIYETELADFLSRALWEGHLAAGYSEERLAEMERCPPVVKGGIEAMEAPVRAFLADRKLREAVTGTEGTDAEREDRWRIWCFREVERAEVEIPDEALRSMYEREVERFRAELPAPAGGPEDSATR